MTTPATELRSCELRCMYLTLLLLLSRAVLCYPAAALRLPSWYGSACAAHVELQQLRVARNCACCGQQAGSLADPFPTRTGPGPPGCLQG